MKISAYMIVIIITITGCTSNPLWRSSNIKGTCIEDIINTGELWGVKEVSVNPDGSVTLVESFYEGKGYGLTMVDINNKLTEQSVLKPGQSCCLTDRYHATIRYTFLRSENSRLYFKVTEHFDARAFGDKIKIVTRTVKIKEYKNKDNKPQYKNIPNNLIRVWPTKEQSFLSLKAAGKPVTETKIPAGFILSPLDISKMCSPRKYSICIYADDADYYAAKFKASADDARRFGECINGRTGEITHPKEKNRYSILFINSN